MFGAPTTGEGLEWEQLLPVVSGRIVNCYCTKDWILKFVFRGTTAEVCVDVLGIAFGLWLCIVLCMCDLFMRRTER